MLAAFDTGKVIWFENMKINDEADAFCCLCRVGAPDGPVIVLTIKLNQCDFECGWE